MSDLLDFHGPNAGYILELYERYEEDPNSVDAEVRALFQNGFTPPTHYRNGVEAPAASAPAASAPSTVASSPFPVEKIVAAARLGRIVRELGHRAAALDPLGTPPPGDPELTLEEHHLTDAELERLPASVIGGPLAATAPNAKAALASLRATYSGSIGYEDDHVQEAEERDWLRNAIETGRYFADFDTEEKKQVLEQLTAVDTFEQFLQTTPPYMGEKRFSIEGCDMMVPMLETILARAAARGTREVVMGMAHRGRLNVLAHVLQKPYEHILAEFVGKSAPQEVPAVSGTGFTGYTGDVKYHKGYRRSYSGHRNGSGAGETEMRVTLAPNPSHLEFVGPVVVGRARAAQDQLLSPGEPEQDIRAAFGILIHGDAAFPGQGVVAETLNMSQLRGYTIGGTIHIIANNQIGFTTLPRDGRSTLYASDLAKGFEIPIVHVNADDPAACIAVAKMAFDYHARFGKDFLIDLIGYRRLGHNETDEPAYTQPDMYRRIRSHPRVREIWAEKLVTEGVVSEPDSQGMVAQCQSRLREAKENARNIEVPMPPSLADTTTVAEPGPVQTAVPAETLQALNESLNRFPDTFHADPKLERQLLNSRREALNGDKSILWAHAESLAFASLLSEGVPIRLTGQDSERGTFTQRHLVLHDTQNGNRYCSLQHLPQASASFALYNSPLSEMATVGFEYGYSVHATNTLVLWEAQFGDFSNGAQVIIDQFMVSGNAKWGQSPSLVLLLPHGYEGQGPEHSSGRIERFLQLCAGDNVRVANCTSAAQYFHLLRRHARQLESVPRPLVVFTPKSLLRHPRAAASVDELTEGTFQPVLDDPRPADRKDKVSRLLLCSGKVYVDLVYGPGPKFEMRSEYEAGEGIAVGRVEELNPFPADDLRTLLASYPNLTEVVWVQEEPQNMGAWFFVEPRLRALLGEGISLRYIGRPEAASPAEGSLALHTVEQARIISEAFADAAVNSDTKLQNAPKSKSAKVK
ncbi:MAG: 2-oxoglutarate dehydrogenase E1 component [Armatimonadaceae bacterium]